MTTVASSSYTPTIFTLFLPPLSSPHPRRVRILLVLVATSRQSWPTSAMFSRPLRVFDNFEMALALILTRFCLASRQWWCGVLLEILIQFLVSREQGYVSELINLAGVGGALRRRGFFPPSFGIPLSKTVFHLCQPGIPWKFGSVFEIPEAGITSCLTFWLEPGFRQRGSAASKIASTPSTSGTVLHALVMRHTYICDIFILCLLTLTKFLQLYPSPSELLHAYALLRQTQITFYELGLQFHFFASPRAVLRVQDREYFKYFAFNYVFTHAPS
ncbi:hypothetical protein C8R43DRAFT_1104210 [Mycena crocata]|nr:hypothetical protein C8R43DRAFT_1104208 [Mycena crocata]KAJ7165610.1 hypothetical protein C8R43DRAFT_1104210 [Mycena crocata]